MERLIQLELIRQQVKVLQLCICIPLKLEPNNIIYSLQIIGHNLCSTIDRPKRVKQTNRHDMILDEWNPILKNEVTRTRVQ